MTVRSKEGITYNGDREKSDLVDFIKDNASNADDIKKHLSVTEDLWFIIYYLHNDLSSTEKPACCSWFDDLRLVKLSPTPALIGLRCFNKYGFYWYPGSGFVIGLYKDVWLIAFSVTRSTLNSFLTFAIRYNWRTIAIRGSHQSRGCVVFLHHRTRCVGISKGSWVQHLLMHFDKWITPTSRLTSNRGNISDSRDHAVDIILILLVSP